MKMKTIYPICGNTEAMLRGKFVALKILPEKNKGLKSMTSISILKN